MTVRQRKDGEYWVFIHHKGKRKAKKIGQDKKLAYAVAKKAEAQLLLGDTGFIQQPEKQVPLFEHYAKTWIDVMVPAICKPSTIRDYRCILDNHLLPVFGKLPVNAIKRLAVKEFLMGKVTDGYASSTVTHMKNAISGVLNMAVDDEIIALNPAQRLGKIIRYKSLQLSVEPLSRGELILLLETFKEHYPAYYPLILTLARTGMRIGEALALQWGDIDFNGRFITIQRNIARGKVGTPKNGKARRVDVSKQLNETLLDLKHQRKVQAVKMGWGKVPEWVFISETGGPIDAANWRNRVFNKALDKAGLRKIHPHMLRHTYASFLIQSGVSLAYIRDQLGHHSIKVTVDIYGHLAPEGNKAAVDSLDMQPDATQAQPEKEKHLAQTG
ncbi:MAG: tyrosine-type recombinase/integrase [Pseudomonadota bacterium]